MSYRALPDASLRDIPSGFYWVERYGDLFEYENDVNHMEWPSYQDSYRMEKLWLGQWRHLAESASLYSAYLLIFKSVFNNVCVCEVPWRCESGGLTNAQRNFWSIPQSKMKTFGGGRREKLKNHYACNMIIRVYVDVMFALWKSRSPCFNSVVASGIYLRSLH